MLFVKLTSSQEILVRSQLMHIKFVAPISTNWTHVNQLPGETARQLPDRPTTIGRDSSPTGKPRSRGALKYSGRIH